ncbi:hypothetical protein [Deinococcus hopiensis]|nr:hypothetical protein [Deinococcus hopiensis]
MQTGSVRVGSVEVRSGMALPPDPNAPQDFDFITGDWRVNHRRLSALFSNCTQWTAFEGASSTTKTLGGFGNLEDNVLHFPTGTVRALAVRSYCAAAGTWSIWWLDGRSPTTLGVPVVGRFAGHVGTFYADDVLGSAPIRVRFVWTAIPGENPRWEQAFSNDGGKTWETNWTMAFMPVGGQAQDPSVRGRGVAAP